MGKEIDFKTAFGPRLQTTRPAEWTRSASSSVRSEPWFRRLDAVEWSQLDWDVQQRVRALTPDEIPALQRQADGSSVVAQTVLGLAYRDGVRPAGASPSGQVFKLASNNTLAWKWLRKAAKAGFPIAQTEIGEMYFRGHGTERSIAKSQEWLAQAAADYPRAKLDLLQVQEGTSQQQQSIDGAARALLESFGVRRPIR